MKHFGDLFSDFLFLWAPVSDGRPRVSCSPPEEGRVDNFVKSFCSSTGVSPAVPNSQQSSFSSLGPKRARLAVCDAMPCHPLPPLASPAVA